MDDGRPFRLLCVIDEFTRRCLAIVVARRLRSGDVLRRLADLFVEHGHSTLQLGVRVNRRAATAPCRRASKAPVILPL